MKTRNMILISMFAALTAIGAQISIPTKPVPFTLQVLFCIYSGILLGSKRGAMSQIVYVLLGLAGLPIFAEGKGGLSAIASPTFGYLIGFIVCSYVAGKIMERFKVINLSKLLLASVSGLLVVYIIGIAYLYLILNNVLNVATTFNGAMKLGFYPFILQDLAICVIISVTSLKLVPALRKAGYQERDEKKEALN